ncbi:AAA family ATPase [Dyella sp. M7H15-1]|uniref:RNA-binding domain-containing protein n=1 Tax=Dyella sp. M7H15-1 TaxID=2501295 RepID=UPI001004DE09|nr:RNA-binding domain-containing protein [Dyella sp. M7H15-1]QAU25170.1 AAA family ATPase [Dyella sp. M7H15-1]
MNKHQHDLDISSLAESQDMECKAAQGRDGQGELPEDVWKTYSAMANTDGGVILLGIKEKPPGQFLVLGVPDVERVRKALWDNLHNRKQISVNLLTEDHVTPIPVDGKTVLRIRVPRASRQQRPVHLGTNPFGGTYLRRHEGDYQADDENVRRLLAERVEDSRDERVLKGYDFRDLNMDTVAAYRNRFAAVKPGHVWTDLPTDAFLERIGAWGRDRDEGYDGLRLAGLLMFGRAEVIRDALPHYMVDFQERSEPKAEKRWIDRLIPDGSWSGNVYDFFRKVYQKLTADLKVPFQLQDGQRIEDTPVHEALREALVNTLIHADYSGRVSVLVVKRPDMFGFRNPGRMRIPLEMAIRGGNSDCRNRRLQTMFQLVGYGDHAGSGLPKIYTNWAGQHWRKPLLYELTEPEQTLMELRMSSLVPEAAVEDLSHYWGNRFTALRETARLALITAQVEGQVSHDRLKEITTDHPADLTKLLSQLVRDGFLTPDGAGRGMVYFLPWQRQAVAIAFESTEVEPPEPIEPPELGTEPPELGTESPKLATYLDWDAIPVPLQMELQILAEPVAVHRRVDAQVLRTVTLSLCKERFLGLRVLAHVLQRDPDDLRKRTLTPMIQEGVLRPAFTSARDPRQAYTSDFNVRNETS